MTQINPYSKLGYLAISKESTEAVAVKPAIYLELLSEDIVAQYRRQPVQPIAGKVDMTLRSVPDTISVAGSITATIDPKNVGYILSNFFGLPTTVTIQATKVFEHVFEMSSAPATYTFDIKPADDTFVNRYLGVKINSLEISQSDNKMQIVIQITARKAFTGARITQTTVSATQFHVDQTTGLTTADIVEFRDRDDPSTVNATASVSSITDENIFVVGSTASVTNKDIVTLRKSAALYTLSDDFVWIGGAKYGDGDDINNAETANDTEDAVWTFAREVEERWSAQGKDLADRFPTKTLLKGFAAEGTIQHCYQSPKFSEQMRQGEKRGLRAKINGKAIDTNSAQAAVFLAGAAGGASSVRATASVASETSSNLNVRIETNNVDTLAAEKAGNNIVVKKADTDSTKNTATLVAAAVNALSGVTAAADGAGTGEVALLNKTNFGSGTLRRGRDANETEQLRLDVPDARFDPFNQNNNEDNIVQEEITWKSQYDTQSAVTTRVVLRNDISSYA